MKEPVNIPVGAAASSTIEVTKEMTVAHFVEGMPEVYGTPIMIFHMETTAGAAIQEHLPEGWVSVGVGVNVKHLAATPVGATVTLKAEVIAVEDKTVLFAVEAHDGSRKIGEGTHARAPVEIKRFMKKLGSNPAGGGQQ
ncbi:MAG TPA: thioesterase family protein [Blastocatellia bacterium]|jgi:predicted thioesterase